MRKTMMVWSTCAAAVLPACAAGTAMADGVPVQAVGQQAASTQSANSAATSTQTNPTNNAISVAILSPGASSGPVSQANNSTASSAAANTNATTQNAGQGAGAGAGAAQQAVQVAANAQAAASSAASTQKNPTNNAIHVAILSPHSSSGPVSQANNSSASSAAKNTNTTDQTANQAAGGGGGGGGGGGAVQAAGQEAYSGQTANSSATSTQDHPTNNAIHVAILSPHSSSGPVSQSNNSSADSTATNSNTTTQNADQSAGAAKMVEKAAPRTTDGCASCAPYERPKDGCEACHPSIPGVQGIGQLASNEQSANSSATSTQTNPSNTALALSILSPGASSGPVSQANNSTAYSTADNTNSTRQDARQALGFGGGVQAIGQAALNGQLAGSSATSDQWCPTNFALSGGGSGPVSQANNSSADSTAKNDNTTYQNALQALAGAPLRSVMLD
jgi:hypothetical protein